jgi:predicted nucleic acid-binding protein
MILHYLDASAWVKRYYEEPGTSWVDSLFAQNAKLACASLGLIEVVVTLARKGKHGEIDPTSLTQKLREVDGDWGRFVKVQLGPSALDLARQVAADQALRGADAIHLASALLARARLRSEDDGLIVVASDHGLKAAARASGLTVIDPEEQ